ncbi:MAG: hypothetical protein ACI9VR_005379 [Cognaticolwellia sp.]|jgi:hypothetical protein
MAKSYNKRAVETAGVGAGNELISAGLDPALVDGLKKGDPTAVSAAAEIVGNAMVQELMGMSSTVRDGAADLADGAEQGAKTANPKRIAQDDWQEDQLESRQAVTDGVGSEGSGEHARLTPAEADYANWAFWYAAAGAAQSQGLKHASHHMWHFLGNSGERLDVDLDEIGRLSPKLMGNIESVKDLALREGLLRLSTDKDPQAFEEGEWRMARKSFEADKSSFERSESEDLYLAIGGNDQQIWGRCTYLPDGSGGGEFIVTTRVLLEDDYNWDAGKMTHIGELVVQDTTLGRLHAVGLAQEYDIRGERTDEFRFQLKDVDQGVRMNVKAIDDADVELQSGSGETE